ncbi:PSP1 domain-containing protein [Listeria booriae]|uniref:Stage 0 sporulation family protein n=1 Tax=Listeria booriae TaxID=1552123 RepID=A0A7X1CLB5_9LIST|nr:stage 0 sporulation family protein [Listeria booriae]MBC1793047.1 stage 0 sporulation family protein [Listeria booriae]MBC1800611.1 stage 0 sporulation family protein [Listeria booriae]
MPKIVGVRFKEAGKIYYFSPEKLTIKEGQGVIVENAQGIEFGKAVIAPRDVDEEDVVLPLKRVIRVATDADYKCVEENSASCQRAFLLCDEKIHEHKIEMNLVDVDYTFDRNKIIFYFTAEGRVDFRELVKDLASIFRTRIELRQIGVRDEAKLLGGVGPCGRMLCCSTFLGDFEPVSIKMAKDQNLSLNPTKISGLCGRLMCCLKYENDEYEAAKKEMPDVGQSVVTPDGKARVVGINLLSRLMQVRLPDQEAVIEYALEELRPFNAFSKTPAKS